MLRDFLRRRSSSSSGKRTVSVLLITTYCNTTAQATRASYPREYPYARGEVLRPLLHAPQPGGETSRLLRVPTRTNTFEGSRVDLAPSEDRRIIQAIVARFGPRATAAAPVYSLRPAAARRFLPRPREPPKAW